MTQPPLDTTHHQEFAIIVVDDETAVRSCVTKDIQTYYGDFEATLSVEPASSADEALALFDELISQGVLIPLVISDYAMPQKSGLDLFRSLRKDRGVLDTRHLLLSGQIEHTNLSAALTEELVDGYQLKPYQSDHLKNEVKRLVSLFFMRYHFDLIQLYPKLVSHDAYLLALRESEAQKRHLTHQIGRIKASALARQEIPDENIFNALTQAIQTWVNRNSKQDLLHSFPQGQVILREGEPNDRLWFLLEGEVIQEKAGQWGPVHLGDDGKGNIFGLLSYMTHHPSFSTIHAKTPCVAACFDRDDLNLLISTEEDFIILLLNTVLRILKRRLMGVSETKVELQDTLQSLKQAQVQLVEAEKMATLGIMTAGVAHELNNPSAALQRGAEHVQESLETLTDFWIQGRLTDPNQLHACQTILKASQRAKPYSTIDLRNQTQVYSKLLPRNQARKRAEIELSLDHNLLELDGFQESWLTGDSLDLFYLFFEVGSFLGNIRSSSSRIAQLVQGMKNYARAETAAFEQVDICSGLEDTYWVLQNRLKNFQFEKEFLTTTKAWGVPSQLNQVWTNLLSNACDASQPGSMIKVVVDEATEDGCGFVRISIIDQGGGIPIELQSKIFEPRFTTKKGEDGHYGLGLGLAIVHKIIRDHGGHIRFVSQPGQGTTFTVLVPVAPKEGRG